MPIIHWFRRDLRLRDNTALTAALLDSGGAVLPVFILDDALLHGKDVAPARVQFLLDCLRDLAAQLQQYGARLIVRRGQSAQELLRLARETSARAVYYNRDYTPPARARDNAAEAALNTAGVAVKSFRDLVIHDPDEVVAMYGKPYTVFSPYKRAWVALPKPAQTIKEDWAINTLQPDMQHTSVPAIPTMEELGLATAQSIPRGGETEAMSLLYQFVTSRRMAAYNTQRDFLAEEGTSRLSPHLRFGTISPRLCYARASATLSYEFPARRRLSPAASDPLKAGADVWISELIWREFYCQALYHFPHADHSNFNPAYNAMQWGSGDVELDQRRFAAWRDGRTGYPIVDAAMRELHQTAWMHNRARMIVASFLTKDLLLDWRMGESYFMQMLVDGDPASNNGGWQWAAGTGTDAQPYFRIFNPVLQSKRYDPSGRYIRNYVPEMARVPDAYIHEPWTMPAPLQNQVGCVIGRDYPAPIVDHATQREVILRKFKEIRS